MRVTGTKPSLALEGYTGTYTDSLIGRVEIVLENGALGLRQSSQLHATLDHWNFDTFKARWDNLWQGTSGVTFEIGAGGTVEAVRFEGARLTRLPR